MRNQPLVALVLLLVASVSSAGAQGLTLGVAANHDFQYPGDRLELTVSAQNTGGPGVADFYAGVITPDGQTVATIGPNGAIRLGSLASPAAFLPLATGVSLAGPFSAAVDPVLAYVWNGAEPIGTYTIFLAAVRAGGFADNRIDAGDILGLRTGGLNLGRRAALTANGPTVSAAITADNGGAVSATSTTGVQYTLALPAGAVVSDTTITATPVAATGLPVERVLGAVRFGPDGLRLRQPAVLTVTVPAAIKPLGLMAFTMKDDGSGLESVPVTVSGSTATILVSHFSGDVFTISRCGPTVTTAVGRAACARMLRNLEEAAAIIEEGTGGTPLPVRVLLAAGIITELRTWILQFIQPSLQDATREELTDPTVHYFLMVALREWSAVQAILAMTAALDTGASLEPLLSETENLIAPAIDARRKVHNAACLEDPPHASTFINRILELAGEAASRGLPVNARTRGISCLSILDVVDLASPLPSTGAPLTIAAMITHSNGAPLEDPLLKGLRVSIEVVDRGLADIGPPSSASSLGALARLETRVTPRAQTGTLAMDVRIDIPGLGFSLIRRVTRPLSSVHPWTLSTFEALVTKSLVAGAQVSSGTIRHPTAVVLPDEQVSAGGASASMTNAKVTLATTIASDDLDIDAAGSTDLATTGSGSASVHPQTSARVILAQAMSCTFSATLTRTTTSLFFPGFGMRVTRDGVEVFRVDHAPGSLVTTCAPGVYTMITEAISQVGGNNSSSVSYTGRMSLRPIP